MIFVEATLFTKKVKDYLNDEQYRALQNSLMEDPAAGDLIPGAGGLRKVRWSSKGKGKRGGVRIIYYWQKSKMKKSRSSSPVLSLGKLLMT